MPTESSGWRANRRRDPTPFHKGPFPRPQRGPREQQRKPHRRFPVGLCWDSADQRGAVLLVPVADRAARRLLIGAVPPDEFLEGNLGERAEDAFDG